MGIINTGSFAKALWPGVNSWYGLAYLEWDPEYVHMFDMETSTKAFEEDVGASGYGAAVVKTQGQGITYDEAKQTFLTRYTHVVYGLGFIITREMMEDDLYDVAGRKRAKGLAFSMRQTKEIVAADVLNNAFSGGTALGDGSQLCADDHKYAAGGGTYANELATGADMSEAALEQSCIDISDFKNDRGLQIKVLPKHVEIPSELVFETARILKSTQQPDVNSNNINALKAAGKFPGGAKVNHYLTDADAFFIKTNCPDGVKGFQRRKAEFGIDNDFDTENAKFKATERYVFGCTDPRGIFGSPGA